MEIVVGTVLGQSIALGMITSAITQVIKVTEGIPGLKNIPFIQGIFNYVDSAHPNQVKIFAALIAVALNAYTMYSRGGDVMSITTAFSAFGSYLAALGVYSTLKPAKTETEATPS